MLSCATIVCVVALASTVNGANMKTVRVSSVVDDHLVTQDITEDPDRNTVLIVVGDVKGFKDFKTSVNLHDFNTRFVALKIVADGKCLLKPISDSEEDHIPGLDSDPSESDQKILAWHKTMYWYMQPRVLKYEEVKAKAGAILADFCRDYKTFNLIPKNPLTKQTDERTHSRTKRWCICGRCSNNIDGYETDVVDADYKGL